MDEHDGGVAQGDFTLVGVQEGGEELFQRLRKVGGR